MLSTIKAAGVVKLIAAKLLTAKVLVGTGVLAGSAATGFVAYNGIPDIHSGGASRATGSASNFDSFASPQEPSAALEPVPQLVVVGRRMTRGQQLVHDVAHADANALASE